MPAIEHASLTREVMHRIKAPHRPVLVVLTGSEIGTRVVVDRSLLIGRDPAADLVLNDPLVSFRHARVEDRGDSWTLVDLDSTNGLSVNAERCIERVLNPNDRILIGGTAISFELQDALQQAYAESVEQMLNIDDLSGLLVRRKFDGELERLVESARIARQQLALLVMDLDGVKKINDTHGHLFGAFVIGQAGRLIGRLIDGLGVGCRFGGDEYLAALPHHGVSEGCAVAEEILAEVRAHHFEKDGIELQPGISIGVAAFPEDASSARGLFEAADKAMYRAKETGRNRVSR